VFIKLVDVYSDGTAYNLAGSFLRLRYRDGFDQPAGLMPGEICHIRIGGMTTANYFSAGHRIRIEIAGPNFPLADRNWHIGADSMLRTAAACGSPATTSPARTPAVASPVTLGSASTQLLVRPCQMTACLRHARSNSPAERQPSSDDRHASSPHCTLRPQHGQPARTTPDHLDRASLTGPCPGMQRNHR
jgi:hypothetical protein